MRLTLLLVYTFTSVWVYSQQAKNPKPVAGSNDHLIMSVVWYQQSAEMRAVYYQCYNYARMMFDQKMAELRELERGPKAVIVDIDETVLDNSPFEAKCIETGQSYSKEFWKEWTSKSEAKALPGSVEFLNHVAENQVEVFYISNRYEDEREVTINNLKMNGFPFADEKHLLLRREASDKTDRRTYIASQYRILLLVGDQLSDFDAIFDKRDDDAGFLLVDKNQEKFGPEFIILPNPMYGDWERYIYRNTEKPDYKQKINLLKKSLKSF